jgi:DNA-binding response OmpR family regulator
MVALLPWSDFTSMFPSQAVPDSQPRTILLVEDDDQLRILLREVLRVSGYTVLEARLNSQAAMLFKQHADRIDLMLTDVMMPGTTGYELAKRLLAWRPDMKVLFMSGLPRETIEAERLLDPSAPFLQKPFDGSTLLAKIREVLHPSSSTPALRPARPLDTPQHLQKEVTTMQATLSALAQVVQHLTQQLSKQSGNHGRSKAAGIHSKRHQLRARRRTFLNHREEENP